MWIACSASARLAMGRWKSMMIGFATPTRAPLTGLKRGGAKTGSPTCGRVVLALTVLVLVLDCGTAGIGAGAGAELRGPGAAAGSTGAAVAGSREAPGHRDPARAAAA